MTRRALDLMVSNYFLINIKMKPICGVNMPQSPSHLQWMCPPSIIPVKVRLVHIFQDGSLNSWTTYAWCHDMTVYNWPKDSDYYGTVFADFCLTLPTILLPSLRNKMDITKLCGV